MKKVLFLLLAATALCHGQELTIPVKLLSAFKTGTEAYVGTDAFGAFYTIGNNEFRKHTEGVILKYKALNLGQIYRADLQNPLQIVLFYRKFNTAVLLDNQLNETARIDFSALPEPLVAEAVGLATQNRLWVYDINTQRIGLFDPAPVTFRPLTPPLDKVIKHYQTDYNYFYWADADLKCFKVNLFGKVTLLGTLPEFDSFQLISDTEAIIRNKEGLYLYSFSDGSSRRIAIAEKTFGSFYYTAQILSIFTGSEINQYKITLPR